ncbi:MAG TPA: haloacid dehalogenase type II [Casimicrobiaceae bacterium]|nr:haloacid dehalogenase type II [Casimicrobiaceae bacterium]
MLTDARAPIALLFDVFGTVVDWRGSIIREARRAGRRKGQSTDWEAFADAWRAGYRPAMDRVRRGELPWVKLDHLHRMILDELIERFGLRFSEREKRELNAAWHRLSPWPDVVRGLERLKRRYCIGTLSNGNVALLVDMARHERLPWDCVFSAELFRRYKPDSEVYLGAAELLGLPPRDVMLVAAHKDDLAAARRCGLKTAFVRRPLEHGPAGRLDLSDDPRSMVNADDFIDLARKLGA